MTDTKKLIVVAEDSAPNRTILSQLLKKFGFDVIECVDGEDALNKISNLPPEAIVDAIFTDIMMPKMSGLELIAALREKERFAETPVIFCTALTEKDQVLEAKQLKARGYIIKPITRDKLQKKCAELFPTHKFPRLPENQ